MDHDRESREAHALLQAAREYADRTDAAARWAGTGGVHHARHLEFKAQAYASLLRAALDLFEDGDLFGKWRTACQDAGLAVES